MPLPRLSLPEIFSVTGAPVSRFCLSWLIACVLSGAPAYAQVSSEQTPQSVAKASPSPAKSPTPKPKASPKKKRRLLKKHRRHQRKRRKRRRRRVPRQKKKRSVGHSVTEKIAVVDPCTAGGEELGPPQPQHLSPRQWLPLGQRLRAAPFHRSMLRSQDLLAIRVTNRRRRPRHRVAAGGSGRDRKLIIITFRGQSGAKSIGRR